MRPTAKANTALVLAAGFLLLFVSGGARFAIGLTLKPIVEETFRLLRATLPAGVDLLFGGVTVHFTAQMHFFSVGFSALVAAGALDYVDVSAGNDRHAVSNMLHHPPMGLPPTTTAATVASR